MAADELTKEQVRELVLLAREDAALWQALKENEQRLEQETAQGTFDPDANSLDAPGMPMLAMLVAQLVDRHYETDEDVDYTDLIFMLRCAVREDLGLPVDFRWDRGIKDVH